VQELIKKVRGLPTALISRGVLRMKILHLLDIFSPYGGGTTALLSQLLRALAQRGHDVTLYTTDFRLDRDYIDSQQGVRVYPFHSWLNLAGLILTPSIVREARGNLGHFDIIHLHGCRSFQNIVVHHYAKKYGIPYIVDSHGSTLRIGKKRLKLLFDIFFGYKILRDASKVVAETEVGVNEYIELGVNQDKIVLLRPLPCNFEEFSQLPPFGLFRTKYSIKEKHVVLFLGRIHWIKGLDFLVESFYELARYRSDVILAIVGPDDGYKSTLERLIDKLNLSDRVLFTGFLGGNEKLSALVDASVVVQTSRYEQGAGVPIEAVLCNTPIIVNRDTGAGEEVRRMGAGYLAEFGNKDDLREKIEYVLNNPAEAKSKTKKAEDYIKSNISIGEKVEEYENLYATCIEASKQRVRSKK
jgi:glycosyltransferase involved in cell wall biosynthesis